MESGSLLEAIKDVEPGVVVFRDDYSVEYVSRTVMLLFGLPADRLLDGRILDFHGEDTAGRIVETLRLVRESQHQVPLSLKLVTRDGHDRYLLVKLLPLMGQGGSNGSICALVHDITALVSTGPKLLRIPVSSADEIELLAPEEIVYVHADNIHSRIRTASGECLCELSLATLEKRLSTEAFFRIHRSYLVNVGAVRKVQRERCECTVAFAGQEARLPVSRDRLHDFLVALGLK